jgi:tetratricopeptide (TPR) repeat protein
MAKKKPEGDKPKRQGRRKNLPDIPDRRAMEGVMHQLVGPLQGPTIQDTPLTKAQQVMYQAFEETDENRRLDLAKKALSISPNCADAYVLLAEHAARRKEALELYEKGVQAGERAIGPAAFQQAVGHFWGILETRPYMRARLGLAHNLWTAARRDEAIQHLQEMLRLNPNDNQGVRYTLAGFLISQDRDDDLAHLLEQYPDEDSAAWTYTKALLAFRQQGDTPEAKKLLKAAVKTNKHVPAYLLGEKFPPQEQPSHYSPGDKNEAVEYIGSFLAGWKATAGAIDWLRQNVAKPRKEQTPQPKGPLSFIKKWLVKNLSQEYDVWQVDFRQMPNWIKIAGEKVRPWMVMVTSRSTDLVLAHDLLDEAPSAKHVWDVLVKAMQHPAAGEPHRPTELQVRADERWESLKPPIEEIGVNMVVVEELDQIDFLVKELTEHMGGKPEPGLLDMPGMTAEMVGSFYEAAAYFYQQSPWRRVGYEAAIKIGCDKYQSGPWYGVLMGQSGMTTGLAVYEDLKLLRRLMTGKLSDEENARRAVATTVMFGDESDLPIADLEAARRHYWTVARLDAYPSIFHKERGLATRPPLAWELELMEGCLRAVPEFVTRRKQDDVTPEEMTVPVPSGQLKLKLSWVGQD